MSNAVPVFASFMGASRHEDENVLYEPRFKALGESQSVNLAEPLSPRRSDNAEVLGLPKTSISEVWPKLRHGLLRDSRLGTRRGLKPMVLSSRLAGFFIGIGKDVKSCLFP